jgi:hypothetical protein
MPFSRTGHWYLRTVVLTGCMAGPLVRDRIQPG